MDISVSLTALAPVPGFEFPITILGSIRRDKAAEAMRSFLDTTFVNADTVGSSSWAYHAFGSQGFLDRLQTADVQAVQSTACTALDAGVDDATVREALNNALRCAPDLIMFEIADEPHPVVDPVTVRNIYRSGEYVALAITADGRDELFEKVASSLAVPDSDIEWLVGLRWQRQFQVFFDGRDLSDDFAAYLTERLSGSGHTFSGP